MPYHCNTLEIEDVTQTARVQAASLLQNTGRLSYNACSVLIEVIEIYKQCKNIVLKASNNIVIISKT